MASDSTQPPHDPPPAYLRQGRIEPPQQQQRRLTPEDTVGRRWGVPALIAWVTLSAFAGALWFAYEQGVRAGMENTPPLIKAEAGPVKVPPDDPGGLEVPHQDKEIYERMAGSETTGQEEATLRPEAERPVSKEQLLASTGRGDNASGTPTIPVPPLQKITDSGQGESEVPPAPVSTAEEAAEVSSAEGGTETKLPPPVPLVPKASNQVAATQPQKPSVQQTATAVFRVQLGAYRTAEAAEGDWVRFSTREESLLGSLDHVIVRADLGGKGIYYRLQAGPLDGPGAARAMCNKLQQRKLGCLVVRPSAR